MVTLASGSSSLQFLGVKGGTGPRHPARWRAR